MAFRLRIDALSGGNIEQFLARILTGCPTSKTETVRFVGELLDNLFPRSAGWILSDVRNRDVIDYGWEHLSVDERRELTRAS